MDNSGSEFWESVTGVPETWDEIQARNERWWREYVTACREADAQGFTRPVVPPNSPLPMWWPLPDEIPGSTVS